MLDRLLHLSSGVDIKYFRVKEKRFKIEQG
jgi:hypothetical protein